MSNLAIKILCSLVLAVIVLIADFSPACAEYYISPQDIKIVSNPQIELNKPLSLEQAILQFGRPLVYTVDYSDAWPGWHATFPGVELWVLGATDKQTAGLIARVIISESWHSTVRGVAIGDSESKLSSIYGPSDYSSDSDGITWHRYFIKNSLQRIIFGVDSNGRIVKIGYSLTAGGL